MSLPPTSAFQIVATSLRTRRVKQSGKIFKNNSGLLQASPSLVTAAII